MKFKTREQDDKRPRGFLEQQQQERAHNEPQQESTTQPEQQHRVSRRSLAAAVTSFCVLCFCFLSGAAGGLPPAAVNFVF